MKVSVIICTYNYAHLISETIESVLNQSYPQEKIEIIVVDDGSTDNTKEVVQKFKNKVTYIHKNNEGQTSAFNVGFNNSNGEVIFFLDSDDLFYPDKIKKVCEVYQKYNAKAVYNSLLLFGDDIKSKEFASRNYSLNFINKINENTYKMNYKDIKNSYHFLAETSGQSYKRELLKKIFSCPLNISPHLDFYLQAMTLLYEDIYVLALPLTGYRQHSQSFSSAYKSKNTDKKQKEIAKIKFIRDVLNTHIDKEPAKTIADSINNHLYYLKYNLEKAKNNKSKGLVYLLKYKTSPTTPQEKFKNKLRYIYQLFIDNKELST
ncbi:MAG: glycosyltransferase family 2 protein [bacterium]